MSCFTIRSRWGAVLAAAAVLIASPASPQETGTIAPAVQPAGGAPAAAAPAAGTPAAGAPAAVVPAASVVDPTSYIIGPGDVVQVFVWRNPELSVQLPVRPDGKISTPLVEDMVAVGKTPTQLARDIESVLAQYIRSPNVNVIVTNPASAFSQVRVVGQVTKPQGLPYRQGLTVLDAVLDVGGLTAFASGNRAKIVRQVNGKTIEIKVRLDDLVNKGDMRQNKDLQPGDVLVVPESVF